MACDSVNKAYRNGFCHSMSLIFLWLHENLLLLFGRGVQIPYTSAKVDIHGGHFLSFWFGKGICGCFSAFAAFF